MTATHAPTGILDPGVSRLDMQTYASVHVSFLDDIQDVLAYAKMYAGMYVGALARCVNRDASLHASLTCILI